MFYLILYIISIFIVFLFLLFLSFYLIFNLIAIIKGAVYLPTKQKEIDFILKNANLKKEQVFFDLGSGDGRIILAAVKKYEVLGTGIEINPLLIFYSKILAKVEKLNNIRFKREDLFKTNIKKANVIFTFLMPNTLKKLRQKFLTECQKNVLIISHGFIIEGWEKYLQKTISDNTYPTYFYRLKFDRA